MYSKYTMAMSRIATVIGDSGWRLPPVVSPVVPTATTFDLSVALGCASPLAVTLKKRAELRQRSDVRVRLLECCWSAAGYEDDCAF